MYQVSNQFKENIVKNARRIKGYIDVHNVIHNFITCTLDDNIYNSETNTFIGSFIAKSGTIKIDYKDSLNLENGSFLLYFGIQLEDETIEYVPMGKMNVYEKISDTEYKFMDNRMYFNNHFDDTNISYPITVLDYLKSVCEQAGCELETTSFPNSDFVISKRPYIDGYIPTMSEIVIAIAQISCSFARINRNGNLELNWFTDIDQSYTAENLSSYPVVYEKYGPVNQVILSTQLENNSEESEDEETGENTINQETIRQDDESIETNGITSLKIIDNPIANLDKDKIVVELWNRLKGFEYIPYNVSSMQGQFHLDTGDMIDIETKDGSAIKAIVMNHTMNYSGGISSSISAEAQSENQITYAQESSSNILMNQNFVKLNAEILNVSRKLTVLNAEINNLNVGNLDATYAKIDLSNVGTEYVSNLFVKTGILENATIVDGRITGTLTGVKITGDLIEANTLAVKDLLLEGEDGLIYQINALASGLTQTELSKEIYQQKLNGTDIVAKSITGNQIAANTITADKINVTDLFAQDINATGTITGLALKGGSININDKFIVNSLGEMDATSGKFTGVVNATGGTFNDVEANNLTVNTGTFKGDINTNKDIYIGNNIYLGDQTKLTETKNILLNKYNFIAFDENKDFGGSILIVGGASDARSSAYFGRYGTNITSNGNINLISNGASVRIGETTKTVNINDTLMVGESSLDGNSIQLKGLLLSDVVGTDRMSVGYGAYSHGMKLNIYGAPINLIGNQVNINVEGEWGLVCNKKITVNNNTGYYCKNTSGVNKQLIGISSSNNIYIGTSDAYGTTGDTNIYGGYKINFKSSVTYGFTGYPGQTIEMLREQSGSYRTVFRPTSNGGAYLGTASLCWNTVFYSSALTKSDLKEKEVIENFDFKVKDFIMGLNPIAYHLKSEGATGKRVHIGLGAQTLASHIKDLNIGDLSMVQASIIDDENEKPYYGENIDDSKLSWSINYTELIPYLILMTQSHEKELKGKDKIIKEQQKQIQKLQEDIDLIKKSLGL